MAYQIVDCTPDVPWKVLHEWEDDGQPWQLVADIDGVVFARTLDHLDAEWRYIDEYALCDEILRLKAKAEEPRR